MERFLEGGEGADCRLQMGDEGLQVNGCVHVCARVRG